MTSQFPWVEKKTWNRAVGKSKIQGGHKEYLFPNWSVNFWGAIIPPPPCYLVPTALDMKRVRFHSKIAVAVCSSSSSVRTTIKVGECECLEVSGAGAHTRRLSNIWHVCTLNLGLLVSPVWISTIILTKNVLRKSYSSMKKKIRKIRIIFDRENSLEFYNGSRDF